MSNSQRRYRRFTVSDRMLHLLLVVSFSVLAFTGLVQKYADFGISIFIIRAFGGIEQIRLIHHSFAVMLIITSIAHLVHVAYRMFVQRKPLTMLPGMKDVTDFVAAVKYNIGLSKEHPQFPRYNFMEKIEYWAVVWGTLLMTVTGYVLWNPILVTKYMPGEVVPAAKIAHGMEAVLAVLSILFWHFYFVHVKDFNKSMLNGYLTEEQMAEEHPVELATRLSDRAWRAPAAAVRYKRLKLYTPLALAFILVSLIASWRWLTAETTAITTVPRTATQGQAYQPLVQPTEALTAATPQALPTPLHVLTVNVDDSEFAGNALPTPTASISDTVATPTPTAAPAKPGQIALPPAIPHPIDGAQAACNTCHNPNGGIKPAPQNHTNFPQDECVICHKVGGTP